MRHGKTERGFLTTCLLAGIFCFLFFLPAAALADPAPAPDPGGRFGTGPIFEAFGTQDLASRWLNHLIFGERLPEFRLEGGPVHEVFRGLLQFYSIGMLVLTSFLLLYFLFSMMVNTAHYGMLLGRRTNQTMIALRVVAAMAFMVPLPDGQGLNAGQVIILRIAQWGSNFASHGWALFARQMDMYPADANLESINPDYARNAVNLAKIGGCMRFLEIQQEIRRRAFTPTAFSATDHCAPRPFIHEIEGTQTSGRNYSPESLTVGDGTTRFGVTVNTPCAYPEYASDPAGMCGQIVMPAARAQDTPDSILQAMRTLYGADVTANLDRHYDALVGAHALTLGIYAPAFLKYGAMRADRTMPATFFNASFPATAGAASLTTSFPGFPSSGGEITGANSFWREVRNYENFVAAYYRNISSYLPGTFTGGQNGQMGIERLGWMFSGALFNIMAREQHIKSNFRNLKPEIYEGDGMALPGGDSVGSLLQQRLADIRKSVDDGIRGTQHEGAAADFRAQFENLSLAPAENPFFRQRNSMTSSAEMANNDMGKIINLIVRSAGCSSGLYAKQSDPSECEGAGWSHYITRFNPNNAVYSLVSLGHKKFDNAIWLYTVATGLSFGGNFLGSLLQLRAPIITGLGQGAIGVVITVMLIIASAGFIAGLLLAFIIPLQIFIRFLFGIMAWVVSVLEAFVAVPVMLIAHLNPEGESFMPESAKTGYFYVLQIFLRPVMMVFALVLALLLINTLVGFLNMAFGAAAYLTGPAFATTNPLNIGWVGPIPTFQTGSGYFFDFIFMLIYAALAFAVVNNCSRIIDILPDQTLSWIGRAGKSYSFSDDSTLNQGVAAVGTYMAQQGAEPLVGAVGNLGGQIGGGINTRFTHAQAAGKIKNMLADGNEMTAREIAQEFLDQDDAVMERYGRFSILKPMGFGGFVQRWWARTKSSTKLAAYASAPAACSSCAGAGSIGGFPFGAARTCSACGGTGKKSDDGGVTNKPSTGFTQKVLDEMLALGEIEKVKVGGKWNGKYRLKGTGRRADPLGPSS